MLMKKLTDFFYFLKGTNAVTKEFLKAEVSIIMFSKAAGDFMNKSAEYCQPQRLSNHFRWELYVVAFGNSNDCTSGFLNPLKR